MYRRGDNSTRNRLTKGTLLFNNNVWQSSYRRIAISNDILENIDKVPMGKAKVERLKAEAKFIRATQYFYLRGIGLAL
ncbi:RagB/SusD family nutrient uptake outer membrane protein [Telluribacter sp.]|jgi:hypothetical protein|uniref:RagB/SusD family nutrient uptake outer membrane protein n=1 Tax=Telluribacter sp. TaxID=1978767 RepID=UPI002E0D1A12|nr:RagB/SusD family nutrient uptake outer membrane protein [Telluribacter sp.]